MDCVDELYNTGLPFFLGISMTDKERLGSNQLNLFDGLKPNSPKQAQKHIIQSFPELTTVSERRYGV